MEIDCRILRVFHSSVRFLNLFFFSFFFLFALIYSRNGKAVEDGHVFVAVDHSVPAGLISLP